ncbi:ATP-binding protein [Actinoplanes sp. NPDC023936]|uniref:ATP-binding protein n=1 Tax=Actinoplanes sp. NPDC023936 TaxID=3154910 RepID=UPI0034078A33
MKTSVERSLDTGITTVRVTGELNQASSPAIRSVIGTAVAECPTVVIVDLAQLSHDGVNRLSLFPTLAHNALNTWGVPVLLCVDDPALRRDFAAYRTFVALYEHQSEAQLVARAYVPRRMRQSFPPVPASVGGARGLLGEACTGWGLDQLRDTAQLISSELATNAVTHAGTAFDLLTAYTGRYLRISVQDGDSRLPRITEQPPPTSTIMLPGSGRGLRIVAAVATHWGATATDGGKTVWALLKAGPR